MPTISGRYFGVNAQVVGLQRLVGQSVVMGFHLPRTPVINAAIIRINEVTATEATTKVIGVCSAGNLSPASISSVERIPTINAKPPIGNILAIKATSRTASSNGSKKSTEKADTTNFIIRPGGALPLQQCLTFRPLPHGQASLRRIFVAPPDCPTACG